MTSGKRRNLCFTWLRHYVINMKTFNDETGERILHLMNKLTCNEENLTETVAEIFLKIK